MKRLGVREFQPGMKVQWHKNGVTNPEVLVVHKIVKSPLGRTSIEFTDGQGRLVTNHNPGNRYIPAP